MGDINSKRGLVLVLAAGIVLVLLVLLLVRTISSVQPVTLTPTKANAAATPPPLPSPSLTLPAPQIATSLPTPTPEPLASLTPQASPTFAPFTTDGPVVISGTQQKWHPLTLSFSGPTASETDENPNPFLDYRLQVTLTSPAGGTINIPGYFAGNGAGGGQGNIWQIRFHTDEAGLWQFHTSFRQGPALAIQSDPDAGTPLAFDGTTGSFWIEPQAETSPGFLSWGRLEYVNGHYFKFRDGGYWLKGGTNSPENFLGYAGFDNTFDQGGIVPDFLHHYEPHLADARPEDPFFISADSGYDAQGIIGALNYLGQVGVNSIYFLPMNLGGDGQDTYPFIGASGSHFHNTHYDISKLHQWNIVFDHAQRQGIALHIVLNETEEPNRLWLDQGALDVERKLFYREMIARFAYLLAFKWNLSEESVFSLEQIYTFTDYIQTLDWANHPVALHTPSNLFDVYNALLGDPRFVVTSMQYDDDRAGEYVETWRTLSTERGYPWVIEMDENNPAGIGLTDSNADELRKRILYDVYFSGGTLEWYGGYHELPLGGDMRLEDFRTREAMWHYMRFARQFMATHLPFWQMIPADALLSGEADAYGGGEVFALPGMIYAIYLPDASPSGMLDLSQTEGMFNLRWFNPRTGQFTGETMTVAGNTLLDLGTPPLEPDEDWVVLLVHSSVTSKLGPDHPNTQTARNNLASLGE